MYNPFVFDSDRGPLQIVFFLFYPITIITTYTVSPRVRALLEKHGKEYKTLGYWEAMDITFNRGSR